MSVEETLQSLGVTLPQVANPVASYVPAVQTGNLVFCSGQLPTTGGKLARRGKVGEDVTEDDAYNDAQTAALNALAAIKSVIGNLDRIRRVVRVTGYVNSGEAFTNQPVVVDGASDFFLKVFGDKGQHSRVAIGVYQLPLNAPVEIDVVVEVA
ncbi:MAG TPA: RidA family protein [Chloroflexota bacterium]|nr:RidA family protein [Chloroflexota bacterium]